MQESEADPYGEEDSDMEYKLSEARPTLSNSQHLNQQTLLSPIAMNRRKMAEKR